MGVPSLSRCQFAVFTVVTAAACFAGSLVSGRAFGPQIAQAAPREAPPLVINVPAAGEFFVSPSLRTLMTLHEEGSGATLEIIDPAGHRVVVSDYERRLGAIERVLDEQGLKRMPPIERSFDGR
jgi:hypothetical protein